MKLELITLIVVLAFFGGFAYVSSTGNHEWGGVDDQAENVIFRMTGDSYQPWFQSIYTPPSSEIENVLFALEAAIGSMIIGYFLGYYRALAKVKSANLPKSKRQN